jgi:hypothetical protein
MKRFYFLSLFTMIFGLVGFFGMDVAAQHKGHRITNSGNTKATGGNGGKADGKNAHGGNGGSANAKGGSIKTDKNGSVKNSGNTEAKGGDGGKATGDGAKGGKGGDATAQGGDIGTPPKKNPNPPKDKGKGKDEPKAGGGGGGTAKAGDTTATGGKGGDANGKGATGGAGGDAIAVSGNNNTVINGNVTVNNNITYTPGKGGKGKGKGGNGNGGALGGLLGNLLGRGQGGGSSGGSSGGDSSGGFAQGGGGGDGAIQGTPGTSTASSPSETVITNDGSPAIAQGANGKDNVENAEVEQVFTRRYLKVKNDSGVPMKVFVQYRGQDDKKWAWFPADPTESKDALVYDLKPGQEMFVQDKGNKLSASRVRIWGVADSQTWFDFRDQDLWVVPEMDQSGEHRYQATEMRTFTFIFPKQENSASN